MPRPTTRVLTVLELLQRHGRMSGTELARRLEVSGRTLRRYITALEDLGIPITAERGRHGAYVLVAGFKLPPMMFTDNEALALSVGLLAARSLGLAEGASAVASAQAKLGRVMPADLKMRVQAVDETVTLDLSRPQPAADNVALIPMSTAAQANKRVHMRYRAATGAVTGRDFDPYGLAFHDGHWYVGGMCHLRHGLRSFRLDRVQSVTQLDESFTRPPDFDTAAHLTFSIATLPRAIAVEVFLQTDIKTAVEALTGGMGLFAPRDGGVLLRGRTNDLDWYARQLARLSCVFEIHHPAELREAVRELASRLLRQADA